MTAATLRVQVSRVRGHATPLPLPSYMSPHAAGLDLAADIDAPLELAPGARALVPTGLAIAIPPGYEGQVRPRSGRAAAEGLTVLNAPGTIDADFRGEVRVLLVNLGEGPIRVMRGDRIAQLVVAPVVRVEWEEVPALPETARGGGGFGSTGTAGGEPRA
ncbi:MAG TPA: dUTP diphosphatase [Candidatus Limnocylindria bacterium]|nr:dUTP diphosphatase [Candidatus Limnocylindria bacterium]